MTWTYGGSPTPGSLDEVRFLIQDTDTTDQLFQDEEIQFVMSSQGTGAVAALYLVRRLVIKFARFVDTTVGEVSESASQRVAQYKLMVDDLQNSISMSVLPTFGGVNVADVLSAAQDTSQEQPAFERGQYDNPNAGNTQ